MKVVMNMVYGYARCSTSEERQDINRQDDRAEFQKLLDAVKEGDTIVATEVSRLTRSTKHLCEILKTIQDKKLILNIGGSFLVNCSTGTIDPMTEGMIKMWGVFAEMERNIISQRVCSGMKNAAAKGKKIGRPQTTSENLPDRFWKYYQKYMKKEVNISEFARLMNCSRVTVYKYIDIAQKRKSNLAY